MSFGAPGGNVGSLVRAAGRDRSVLQHTLTPGLAKRVWGYSHPYRTWVVGLVLLTALEAGAVIVTPLLLRALVDEGVQKQNPTLVIWFAVAAGVIALLEGVLQLAQRKLSSALGESIIFDLRRQLFSHVLKQSVGFFVRSQQGALISRLSSDVVGAQQAFTATLQTVVTSVVSLVGALIAMVYLSWPLTVAALIVFPLFWIPSRIAGRKVASLRAQQNAAQATMTSRISERFGVTGALLVKLYGQDKREARDFEKDASSLRNLGVQVAMAMRTFVTLLTTLAAVAAAVVYGIGGWLAANDRLTVGTLLAMTALIVRVYGPLTSLGSVRVDVMSALVSFERVFEVLDFKPRLHYRDDGLPLPDGPLSVELSNVTYTYAPSTVETIESLLPPSTQETRDRKRASADQPVEPALKNVSLNVPAGTTTAVVGPSGAGKTTLSGLVARLFDPDPNAGVVKVGGVDVRDVTSTQLRARVGVVTQDAMLFHTTVRENLRYVKEDATYEEMVEALQAAQVWDVIENLPEGLDTVVGDRGHRLSGGEKQRVALARLLLLSPDVVILDEATAHLDSESEAAVQEALGRVLAGRTCVVIAHRLSTIRDADQVVVLEDGAIVQQGTHDALLQVPGTYQNLWQKQQAAARETLD